MSVDSEITLNGQDTGVEYEYRVITVNSAGEGPASNMSARPSRPLGVTVL
jgi:hypothetical protein